MNILAIRTDSPVGYLAILNDGAVTVEMTWESGRQLARDILSKIQELCEDASVTLLEVDGVICYEGPGSFTGLRIGITVGNTLAYANGVPIAGSSGDDWLAVGCARLVDTSSSRKIVHPVYGSEPHITL